MVQRADTRRKSSDMGRRRSRIVSDLNIVAVGADISDADISYRKIDCESLDEVLRHCKGIPPTSKEVITERQLGVHALEKESLLPPHRHSLHISSPRMLYGSQESQTGEEKYFFKYPQTTSGSGLRASNADGLTEDKSYTVESVSTNSIKSGKIDHATNPLIPTYTVVFLGELSVGKSALCKKFYKSGMVHQRDGVSTRNLFQQLDLTDDDDSNYQDYYCDSSDQMKYADSHHVYERPVKVDGRCMRLRVLDINSEKHHNECGSECGDFEPFLGVGEAYALTYSIADRGTFQTVMEILARMTGKHADTMRSLPVILVGNKCDLVRNRQVTKADGIKLATSHNIKFIETSASLNENVTELFEGLIQQIQLRRTGDLDGGTATTLSCLTSAESSSTKENKEVKATRKGSGSRKKRRPKRMFTRRLTEFLTGSNSDSKTVRAKSCQDLTVL